MRTGIRFAVTASDQAQPEGIVAARSSPQKHVWRARIVLLSADGVGTMAIQRQTGKGKPTIWRWQARFMAEGVDGLLHEATRPAGKPPGTFEEQDTGCQDLQANEANCRRDPPKGIGLGYQHRTQALALLWQI